MELFVVSDSFGITTSTVNIHPSSTIKQLKQTIGETLNIPIKKFSIHRNHKPLHHVDLTLIDYNISNHCTILVKLRGDILGSQNKLVISFNDNSIELDNIHMNCSMRQIKQLISRKLNKPVTIQQQMLSFTDHKNREITLENDKLLSDYNIPIISSITLKFKFCGFDYLLSDNSLTEINLETAENKDHKDQYEIYINTVNSINIDSMQMYKINRNHTKNLNIYRCILSTMENQKEDMLYHGTSFSNIDKIIFNGFNRDFNIRSIYGKGTYFAKHPNYAVKYCKHNGNGYYAMLVCRVIIGQYALGQKVMNEQSLYKADKVTQYDSLVNNLHNPTIFIINRDYHAIPFYILVFKYEPNSSSSKKRRHKTRAKKRKK